MNGAKVNESMFSLLEALKYKTKRELRVATFGYVVSVNKEKRTLNMQPIIKEKFFGKEGVEYKKLPELHSIPYLETLGTPIVDEYCVCLHLDRSLNGLNLSEYKKLINSVGNIHNLSDGIALFGFFRKKVVDNIVLNGDLEIKEELNGVYDIKYSYNNFSRIQRQIISTVNNKIVLEYFTYEDSSLLQKFAFLLYEDNKLKSIDVPEGFEILEIKRVE